MFEYLKGKFHNNDIIFLQETHSSKNSHNECHNEFKGELNFYQVTTNSCGVVIGFRTTKKFPAIKTKK